MSEGWRSQNSLAAIAENIKASHELYQLAFAPELGGNELHQKIENRFQAAEKKLGDINIPLLDAVSNKLERAEVESLHQELMQIRELLAKSLATQLGLSIGFNSLDGD